MLGEKLDRSLDDNHLLRDEVERLRRRVVVLEKVIEEELFLRDCRDELNQMIVDEIQDRVASQLSSNK